MILVTVTDSLTASVAQFVVVERIEIVLRVKQQIFSTLITLVANEHI